MKNQKQTGHRALQWYIAGLVLATLFVTQGCDSGVGVSSVNNDPNSEKSTEQIRYVYGTFDSGEEHAVRVILDNTLAQERQTYTDEDEYYSELDRLMEEDELTVNASLYHKFIHALHPAEIRLLDMEGEVVIGEYVHTTTEVAAYKHLVDDPSSTPELEEYWGEDGQEVERELSEFFSLIGRPDVLSTQSFKNPFIQSQTNEFINAAKSASSFQHDENSGIVYSNRYMNTHVTGTSTVCLPSSRAREAGLSQWCYSVKFRYWNQSTHTKRRRALAGIEPMVSIQGRWVDLADEGPPGLGARLRLRVQAEGGHSRRTAECYGSLSVGTLDYSNNPPYSYISERSCNNISVVANRKPRRGAVSWHRYGFHEYFAPVTLIDGETYLMYSNSGSWEGYSDHYLR